MLKRTSLVLLIVMSTLAMPLIAHAEEESKTTEYAQLFSTIGILTTTSTVVYFLESLSDRLLDKMFANVGQYLQHNHVAVQHDIALSGGPRLDDLAALFHLDSTQKKQMLVRVRTHRTALVSLLNATTFDLKTTRQFSKLMLGAHLDTISN